MSQVRDLETETAFAASPSFTVHMIEERLDAVCDLIDEEIRSGGLGEKPLQSFTRRIAADIDEVMAQEERWIELSSHYR